MGYTHLLGFEYTCLCMKAFNIFVLWCLLKERRAVPCRTRHAFRSKNLFSLHKKLYGELSRYRMGWDQFHQKIHISRKNGICTMMSSGCHSIAGATLILYGFRLMHLYLFFHAKHNTPIELVAQLMHGMWTLWRLRYCCILFTQAWRISLNFSTFQMQFIIHMTIENDKCILGEV